MTISAYLAGPDVFAPDAEDRLARMGRLCRRHGVTPITPIDGTVPPNLVGLSLARHIKAANLDRIRQASCVIANISPFRGPNMDPGTAYEIGFAEALGKPVFLWSETDQSLRERTSTGVGDVDDNGWVIENFGLAENLMISVNGTAPLATSLRAALINLDAYFRRLQHPH
ncbi:MAG TPA: nucleoside 2-deoxyribosyltransferase [Hyphomicrobiaceae bacterium]